MNIYYLLTILIYFILLAILIYFILIILIIMEWLEYLSHVMVRTLSVLVRQYVYPSHCHIVPVLLVFVFTTITTSSTYLVCNSFTGESVSSVLCPLYHALLYHSRHCPSLIPNIRLSSTITHHKDLYHHLLMAHSNISRVELNERLTSSDRRDQSLKPTIPAFAPLF